MFSSADCGPFSDKPTKIFASGGPKEEPRDTFSLPVYDVIKTEFNRHHSNFHQLNENILPNEVGGEQFTML